MIITNRKINIINRFLKFKILFKIILLLLFLFHFLLIFPPILMKYNNENYKQKNKYNEQIFKGKDIIEHNIIAIILIPLSINIILSNKFIRPSTK